MDSRGEGTRKCVLHGAPPPAGLTLPRQPGASDPGSQKGSGKDRPQPSQPLEQVQIEAGGRLPIRWGPHTCCSPRGTGWCGLPLARSLQAPSQGAHPTSALLETGTGAPANREHWSRAPHKPLKPTSWSLLLSCPTDMAVPAVLIGKSTAQEARQATG